MKRSALFALFLLASCLPSFRPAEPDEAMLTYKGGVLSLTTAAPFTRASIGVRAEAVRSSYCAVLGCKPDSEGRVLLRLTQGELWPPVVALAEVDGLVKAKAVVVFPGGREGVVTTLEPSAAK